MIKQFLNYSRNEKKLRETSADLVKAENQARVHNETLSEKENKIQEKLKNFQELYEHNQKMLAVGRKYNDLVNKYFQTNNKKQFLSDLMKWVTIEKAKHQKKYKAETKNDKVVRKKEAIQKKRKLESVKKEVLEKVKKIRKENKDSDKKRSLKKELPTYQVNDQVRLIDSNVVGTIDKIEKNKALINYGHFTTMTTLDKLELVQSSKKAKN